MEKVKGMRDYLPDYMVLFKKVSSTIEETYKSYGYVPMDSPAMENLETLFSKCGEDMKKQVFVVQEKYGLRFDLTVPFARIVSTNQFSQPFKRYCIAKVWRHEEPQKGRYREFYQADVDITGVQGTTAEAELLACASKALNKLGLKHTLRVNDRKLITKVLEKSGFSDPAAAMRTLDKIDKIGKKAVEAELESMGNVRLLMEFIGARKNNETAMRAILEIDQSIHSDFKTLTELSEAYGFCFEIDFSLVRGLGYYTGMVFEIASDDFPYSIGGGGRYDNLLGLYGKPDFAVGISLGIERIINILESKEKPSMGAQVYIVSDLGTYKSAVELAEKLRNRFSVEIDLMGRKMDKQLNTANKKKTPVVVFFCRQEKESGKLKLKDMKSGEQQELRISDEIKKLEKAVEQIIGNNPGLPL